MDVTRAQRKPGDAFKFDDGVTIGGARSAASQVANGLAIKLAVRATPEGIFCWRVDGLPNAPKNGNYRQDVEPIRDYTAQAGPASETTVVGYERKPPILEVIVPVIPADRMPPEKKDDPI